MHLTLPLAGIDPGLAVTAPAPAPPPAWSRWAASPIARVDYGRGSRLSPWHEAVLPAERSVTGAQSASLTFGGTSRDAAIHAARLLAAEPVEIAIRLRGRATAVRLNPAIAVLHDARAGAYWLAPLQTTVRSGDEWVDAPHSIDGIAFEGSAPLLRAPQVASATSSMVAIVGRDRVLEPGDWSDAPHDSRID